MTTDIVEWAMRPATHAFEYISRPRSIERLIDEWNRAYHCFALAAKEFVLEFAECDEVLLNVLRQANAGRSSDCPAYPFMEPLAIPSTMKRWTKRKAMTSGTTTRVHAVMKSPICVNESPA